MSDEERLPGGDEAERPYIDEAERAYIEEAKRMDELSRDLAKGTEQQQRQAHRKQGELNAHLLSPENLVDEVRPALHIEARGETGRLENSDSAMIDFSSVGEDAVRRNWDVKGYHPNFHTGEFDQTALDRMIGNAEEGAEKKHGLHDKDDNSIETEVEVIHDLSRLSPDWRDNAQSTIEAKWPRDQIFRGDEAELGGDGPGGAETPIVETPIVETPIVETPIVETPIVKAPIVEAPIVEAPIVEAPVVEAPPSGG